MATDGEPVLRFKNQQLAGQVRDASTRARGFDDAMGVPRALRRSGGHAMKMHERMKMRDDLLDDDDDVVCVAVGVRARED